ncbi:MAG: hypothetical protein LBV53_01305 [Mycoplasmataceae bacterium]|jgi:hypothetical protein|nr:hypothetical protein [Mycoplasmataceae bacterium]
MPPSNLALNHSRSTSSKSQQNLISKEDQISFILAHAAGLYSRSALLNLSQTELKGIYREVATRLQANRDFVNQLGKLQPQYIESK